MHLPNKIFNSPSVIIKHKNTVMHPSLGTTAPAGLRVAGYNFTAASLHGIAVLHSFLLMTLIEAFSMDMNVKQSQRASHMYIHEPATI